MRNARGGGGYSVLQRLGVVGKTKYDWFNQKESTIHQGYSYINVLLITCVCKMSLD